MLTSIISSMSFQRGIIARSILLIFVNLIGIILIPFPLTAAQAKPSKPLAQALVEVDPAVAGLSLLGVGGSAALQWTELRDVATRTERALLAACGSEPFSISEEELPRRFAPVANALGTGALLSQALVVPVMGQPGRPALAAAGAWLGAWIGYLLGVRSYALALVAPWTSQAGSVHTGLAPTVSLEWKAGASSPLRLVVEGSPGLCAPERSRGPAWALWALPVVGAALGALLGYSLSP